MPNCCYINTIRESSRIRYVYYGTGTEFKGTLSAVLQGGIIKDTDFYDTLTIEQTIDHLESNWQLIVFWVLWILLIVGCVFGFYYFENRWLDD